jgi:hypothetical protein
MAAPPVLGPTEVLGLGPEGADELLNRLERTVPVRPALVSLRSDTAEEAVVFGDTHGDWRSTVEAVALWESPGAPRYLIGLGDYIDRPPDDCPLGSVANALYLLSLAAAAPERVFLLQGNHETNRRIPVLPHTLPEEVDELWGPEEERYHRIAALFERGPLALSTPNGAYLAHAGFPRAVEPGRWTAAFDQVDDDRLAELVWAEADASRSRRGAARAWGERDLERFLRASGLGVVIRGHDADLCGRSLYEGRCLTLHTTRIYERYGGVIVAVLPLRSPLETVRPVSVRHLSTEGRSFP